MEDENEEFLEEIAPVDRDNAMDESIVLAAMDGDAKDVRWMIRAYRIPEDGGKDVTLFTLSNPRELANIVERLMKYGTGKYRVLAYRNGQLYKKMIYPVEVLEQSSQPQSNELTGALALMAQAMERSARENREFMERILTRQNQTPQISDPLAMMERTLAMAGSLAGLRPEPPANQMTPDAMISLIKSGMEISKAAGGNSEGGGSGETNWMDLIKAALQSPLAEKIGQGFSQPAPAPQNPNSQLRAAPQIETPPVPDMQQARAFMLQQVITTLGNYAIQGTDPAAPHVMNWFLSNVPEDMIDALLQEQNVLDRLGEAFPVIRDKRGWFTAFLAEVQKADAEPVTHERPANDPSGNT